MVSARQEADLRPKLERLDRLIAASEGLDADALTFDFRPLWQLDAATAATVALQKAQATQVYAGLNLWPAEVTARLVEAQLAEDGTYPNAAATFAEASDASSATATLDFDPDQPRDPDGRWTAGGGGTGGGTPAAAVSHAVSPPSGMPSAGLVPAAHPDAILPSGAGSDPNAPDDKLIELAAFKRPGEVAAEQQVPDPGGPDQGASSTSTEAEADPEDVAMMRMILGPPLALLAIRQRAIEAVRSLLNQLPPWLVGGLPPDPPPDAKPAGAGGGGPAASSEALPRPLTIQGGASSSAPPSGPVGPDAGSYSFNEKTDDPVEADPRAAQKLDNALSDYQTRRYTIDNQTFQLDKSGMHDILERHMPEYWNGRSEKTQTFFPEGTTIEHLQDVVRDVLSENRDEIITDPSQYQWSFYGTSGGIRYNVTTYQGRITHLVPRQ